MMDVVLEDVEEYSWKEVMLPSLIPVVPAPELERETGERQRRRDILVAVNHGPTSRHDFHWALAHLCHLIHVVSSVHNEIVYESRELMDKLAIEAFQIALVARIVEGDAGKAICREAERLKPVAVIMGTHGRGIIHSVLQGSVSEYCFRNCKSASIIIVPGKDVGEASVI